MPLVFILLQGDIGTASVFWVAGMILLHVAGGKFRHTLLPVLTLLGIVVMLVSATMIMDHYHPGASRTLLGHRAGRVYAYLHPLDTTIPASFQPRNALVAIGSGGLIGRGLCASRQKWGYLPASHNDYILAIIAEELGLVFTLIFVFIPYLFMLWRGCLVAQCATDEYRALLAMGCVVMFAVQALANMAVVTNLIPCMGINLPFISYGGSSLIANMMMAGLLLNASAVPQKKQTPNTVFAAR